ncbi:DoxX family protein [Mycobacterium yunnanensis]|uniref:DoxX family protein n=1 Tax=Mycobacterium yunnanensis TaxID=368477 RepID=A0A9X3BRL4_9MYCO|nr:DoxX family protein [Mycobacterium yunnanensis]MCV7419075.1 DoxX family protein [Mycobacterium yunnanensis]
MQPDPRQSDDAAVSWSLATRVAFRFFVVYLGSFCVTFAQVVFAFTGVLAGLLPDGAVIWQMVALEPLTRWFGRTALGVDAVLVPGSGSGDQAAIWVYVAFLLTVSALATVAWSVLDRRRRAYPRLAAWFATFLRVCLGGQMLFYGFAKVVPTQMPSPPLAALIEPLGDLSPMALLWLQVGTSHPYEIALGAVEVLAGVLLFIPRTATAGALVSLVGTGQIFLLNMTYGVPVKILSFHLFLISAILVAPEARRLVEALILGRGVGPEVRPALFDSRRRDRLAKVAQVLLGAWVLAGCLVLNLHSWHEFGDGRPKPELYGIWQVTDFSVDGTPRPPLLTDELRWQRVVFDNAGVITYQLMDGTLVDVAAESTPDSLVVTAEDGSFAVDRADDELRLTGRWRGSPTSVTLHRQPLEDFTLRNRGFHWVQEAPFFG